MSLLRSEVNPDGFTAMLERLGGDCSPLQYVREYSKNSIEAIQRTGKPGSIIVDANWDSFDATGLGPKISFIDTGDGMSGEEMIDQIKDLSSTGHQNEHENYGMGAKIASITRNRAGILYESWKEGEGNFILMKYDPDENAYGLQQIEANGEYGYYAPLDDDSIPDIIKEAGHGTRVTLFGNIDDDDTMNVPEGISGTQESWLFQYLNSRFFRIPEGIKVKVRIGYYRQRSDTKHNHLLVVRGQKEILDKHASASGSVELSDAKVHWWILKADRQGHGRENVNGHTAVLNQDEVFDKTDGRGNRAILFGIIFGSRDVALYIEPNIDKYEQDTSRSRVRRKGGGDLPWDKWSDEFRAKMPAAIRAYIDSIMRKAEKDSHEKEIRERLKSVRQFYKVSRYKPSKLGTVYVDPDSVVESLTGHRRQGSTGGSGSTTGGGDSGSTKALLASLVKKDGTPSKSINPDPFPRVEWVSLAKGTREIDELEDRAATFYEKDNLIKANADFQGFIDLIQYYVKEYGHVPECENVVPDVVREIFEQQLIETVAGTLSLRGRKYWSPDDLKAAFSDESLTAAVMVRYHTMHMIKRVLSSRLGKPESVEQEPGPGLEGQSAAQ